MALQLHRATLVAAFATAATAATLAEHCRGVLQLLQGRSDAEFAARCRASFSPEICQEAGSSLGAQPWSSQRIGESCSRFASAYSETDERGLEATVKTNTIAKQGEAPGPLEKAVANKLAAPAVGDEIAPPSGEAAPAAAAKPGDAIGHLLNKVHGKPGEEETAKTQDNIVAKSQKAQKASLRTLMTPLKMDDSPAPEPKGKASAAQKEAKTSQKSPLRQATTLEKHSLAEVEPEKDGIQEVTDQEEKEEEVAAAASDERNAACSADNEDCRESRCCTREEAHCFSKNEHWAACLPQCTKGMVLEGDMAPFDTPWSCEKMSKADGGKGAVVEVADETAAEAVKRPVEEVADVTADQPSENETEAADVTADQPSENETEAAKEDVGNEDEDTKSNNEEGNQEGANQQDKKERTLAKTGKGIKLFGRVGPLLTPQGVSLAPVLGFSLFAAAAAFVSLSMLRTRRRLARDTSSAFLLDVEQDLTSPASSTAVE